MLKLKLQYFGHLMWRVDSLEDCDTGRDWGQEEKGTTEDEMAGWHHWLDGCEFEWTLGVGDGQGGLACCNSWGLKELDTTERLNWTELTFIFLWETSLLSSCVPTGADSNTFLGCITKAGQSGCSIPVVTVIGLEIGINTNWYNQSQLQNIYWNHYLKVLLKPK